jgi:hypothetical protein
MVTPWSLCWNRRVGLSEQDLSRRLRPADGWPAWVTGAPYRASAHPQASSIVPLESGANCQRYAYGVLGLFGRVVPPHRSSELWEDTGLSHHDRAESQDLDLVLFNDSNDAWGAHIAVVVGDALLHLCAEEARPALWPWSEFANRPRYEQLVGVVRVPSASILLGER